MALFIEMNNNPKQMFCTHIGKRVPPDIWRVTTAVHADERELEKIYQLFPMVRVNSPAQFPYIIFVGETAKFIAANWNNCQ